MKSFVDGFISKDEENILKVGLIYKRMTLVISVVLFGVCISACFDESGDSEQSNSQSQVNSIENAVNSSEQSEKSNNQVQADTVKKTLGEASISAKVTKIHDGRIMVTGKTNLPNETSLMVSLSSKIFGIAQGKSIVNNGEFSTGPFGPISGLPVANYVVEITMPIPRVQPESVQSVIGNEGQYLTGPLAKDSSWGGKTVEYSFPYRIGSKEAVQQAELEHVQIVSEIKSITEQLLKKGRAMEQYRNTDDLSNLKICREMMRENQSKAEVLKSKAEILSNYYFDLKTAVGDTYFCVSCLDTVIKDCNRAAKSLKNVK